MNEKNIYELAYIQKSLIFFYIMEMVKTIRYKTISFGNL